MISMKFNIIYLNTLIKNRKKNTNIYISYEIE